MRWPAHWLTLLLVLTLSACFNGNGSGGGETADAGGLTYVKSYGAPGAESRVAHAIVTRDGGTAMVGFIERAQQSDGSFSRGLAVTRTDGAGDVRWSRTYGAFEAQDFKLRQFGPATFAADGGVVIAGQSDEGPSLVKLDADGRFVWQRHYPQPHRVNIHALIRTGAGNFVMAGDIETAPSRFDAFLLSTTGNGTLANVRTDFDDSGTTSETIFAIRERAGGFVIAGLRDGDDWLAELDSIFRPSGIDRTGSIGGLDVLPGVNSRYLSVGVTGLTENDGSIVAENPFGIVNGLDNDGFQKWFSIFEVHRPLPQDPSLPTALFALARDEARGLYIAGGGTLDSKARALTGHLVGVREPIEPVLYPPALRNSFDFDIDFGVLGARTIVWDVAVTVDGDYLVAGGFGLPVDPSDVAAEQSFELEPWVARISGATRTFMWRVRLWRQAPGCEGKMNPQPFKGLLGTTVQAAADGTILFSSRSCVAKLSADGNILWGATSAPAEEDGRRILETENRDFVVVGAKRLPGAENASPWVLRLDSEGRIRWQRLIGTNTGGVATDVVAFGDGFLVTGTNADGDTWFARLDADGRVQSARVYQARHFDDTAPRLATRDGVVMLTVGYDRLARINGSDGSIVWSRRADAAGMTFRDITMLAAGDVAVTGGVHFAHSGDNDFFIPPVPFAARFSADGELRWSNVYATTTGVSINGVGVAIRATADGGLAVAASAAFRADPGARCKTLAVFYDETREACTDMLLFKLTGDGAVTFGRLYGTATSEFATTLALTPDNGFLMVGASDGFNFPRYSGFAVRTDANGRVTEGCPAGLDVETLVVRFTVGLFVSTTAIDNDLFTPTTFVPEVFIDDNAIEEARSCFGESQAPVLSLSIVGRGEVASDPAGIACGIDCEQAYTSGTMVMLRAQPAAGESFIGWGGACTDFGARNPIEVSLNRNLACTAKFSNSNPNPGGGDGPFTLTLDIVGNGFGVVTYTPAVTACSKGGPTHCERSFSANTTVQLTPTAYQGSSFGGWVGCDAIAAGQICSVSMNRARLVQATIN